MKNEFKPVQPKLNIDILKTPDLYMVLTNRDMGKGRAIKLLLYATDKCVEENFYMEWNKVFSSEPFPVDLNIIECLYKSDENFKFDDEGNVIEIPNSFITKYNDLHNLQVYISRNTHQSTYDKYCEISQVYKKSWLLFMFQNISYGLREQSPELMNLLGIKADVYNNSEPRYEAEAKNEVDQFEANEAFARLSDNL